MSLFGPAMHCQRCGTCDNPVHGYNFEGVFNYFACTACYNAVTLERLYLSTTVEYAIAESCIKRYGNGGDAPQYNVSTETRYLELLIEQIKWMMQQFPKSAIVHEETLEDMEVDGRH